MIANQFTDFLDVTYRANDPQTIRGKKRGASESDFEPSQPATMIRIIGA